MLQSSQSMIKTEPNTFESLLPYDKSTLLTRSISQQLSLSASQSPLLRSLIRTSQPSTIATKKDAPLYDLLQNLDNNDASIFSAIDPITSNDGNVLVNNTIDSSADPLEHYLSSSVGSTGKTTSTTKDDYLAALLNTDPQKPSEISFIPVHKQQSTLRSARSVVASTSNDDSRMANVVTDVFNTAQVGQTTIPSATVNNTNDDFLSLLDNKDFLEVNQHNRDRPSMLFTSCLHLVFNRSIND
jgi:hypothetical protein